MTMTDNIADMLTRIRNAQKSKLLSASCAYSRMKCAVLEVLKTEGYINGYSVIYEDNKGFIEIDLKYSAKGSAAISEIHRVSRPGKRVYSPISELKGYYNNMGIHILSTSKGVISDRQAHAYHIGGEVVCKVF